VNNKIDIFSKKDGFDAKITLRAQYGFGDDKQLSRLWKILKGNAILNTEAEGEYGTKTVLENGKLVTNLTGYRSDMTFEEQMQLAVVLGHEAYRDGIVTKDNYLETGMAVRALNIAVDHTTLLIRVNRYRVCISAREACCPRGGLSRPLSGPTG
jgi:hypothetical protein